VAVVSKVLTSIRRRHATVLSLLAFASAVGGASSARRNNATLLRRVDIAAGQLPDGRNPGPQGRRGAGRTDESLLLADRRPDGIG
jgi:hypothetical protein